MQRIEKIQIKMLFFRNFSVLLKKKEYISCISFFFLRVKKQNVLLFVCTFVFKEKAPEKKHQMKTNIH